MNSRDDEFRPFFPLFVYFPILLTSFDIGPSIIEINMPLERFGQVKPITGHPTRYATGTETREVVKSMTSWCSIRSAVANPTNGPVHLSH